MAKASNIPAGFVADFVTLLVYYRQFLLNISTTDTSDSMRLPGEELWCFHILRVPDLATAGCQVRLNSNTRTDKGSPKRRTLFSWVG